GDDVRTRRLLLHPCLLERRARLKGCGDAEGPRPDHRRHRPDLCLHRPAPGAGRPAARLSPGGRDGGRYSRGMFSPSATPRSTLCGKPVATDRALVLAIVKRTPDSFYDRGAAFTDEASLA